MIVAEEIRRIAMRLFEDTQKTESEILARAVMKILKDRAHKLGIDPRKVFDVLTNLRP